MLTPGDRYRERWDQGASFATPGSKRQGTPNSAGQPAVTAEEPQAAIQEIAFRDPKPPRRLNPSLPADLETILLKAMEKDPTHRYASARDMADDLRRFLEDEPVVARRPSLARHVERWVRRHRAVVAATMVALLVSVIALTTGSIRTARALQQSEERLAAVREAVNVFLAAAGLQDSVPRSALHSLHARVEGISHDAWEDPALVQVWGLRYTTYVVPAGDHAAFTLGFFQLFFVVNLFMSIRRGRQTSANPWQATTLEWATPTPPLAHGNFEEAPRAYRSPYEYSVPGAQADFTPQHMRDEQVGT